MIQITEDGLVVHKGKTIAIFVFKRGDSLSKILVLAANEVRKVERRSR